MHRPDEEQVRDHYDRGDDFYAWFLGPRMIYTSGIISDINTEESLEQLQDNKLAIVCEKIGLKPGVRGFIPRRPAVGPGQFRLKAKGMPVLRSAQVGDLYIQIQIETPQKLTKRQRELLQEFEQISSKDNNPESTGFFARMKDFFDTLSD